MRKFFIVSGIFILLLDVFLGLYTKNKLVGGFPIIITSNYNEVYFNPYKIPENKKFKIFGNLNTPALKTINIETNDIIKNNKNQLDQAVKLREWTNRLFYKVGNDIITNDPLQILQLMRLKKGAICGNLADLYLGVLHANGFPARLVGLIKAPPLNVWDTHILVEVYVDGRWVLQDPTFNLYWTIDDKPASAWDIRKYLQHQNRFKSSLKLVYGKHKSIVSMDNYIINVNTLFSHVIYIYTTDDSSKLLEKYTPLRFFKDNIYSLTETQQSASTSPFIINNLYLLVVYGIIPGLGILLIITGCLCKKQRLNQL